MLAEIDPILYLISAGGVVGLVVMLLLLWRLFGSGPRRGRAYRRALRQLRHGDWKHPLAESRVLQNSRGLSAVWRGRLRNLEGECLKSAGDQALLEKRYEEALEFHVASAGLLGLDADEVRHLVADWMLIDARRLFAEAKDSAAFATVEKLLSRLVLVQPDCAEAYFWLGLCQARGQRLEQALTSLEQAAAHGGKRFIDPPLYQGALQLRLGKVPESLRCLSDANRVDSNCPLVAWQLGTAIVAANGDSNMAIRALQRALGQRGLSQWLARPEHAWIEGFPEGASYVRRVASKHPYRCPIFGGDVSLMIRQGELTLAQAHNRLGNFQDAADLYGKMLGESPPSPVLLQGLGIALARLDRHDEAFKHLRAALEQEEPKSAQTGGYLALCGALGKPSKPEDKPRNVQWAIRLLARFDVPGDPEWARLNNLVFAEARTLNLPVALEDQRRLAETLVSNHAADVLSAEAIAHLAATYPDALRQEYAWLYCRAAQQHGITRPQDLLLFGLLFRNEATTRAFYAQRHWDLDEVVLTYLERSAAQQPGQFPAELGPDFPAQGELLLLQRSQQRFATGDKEAALATAQVLANLAPQSSRAQDWLAQLSFRLGDVRSALNSVRKLQQLQPNHHAPVLREAALELNLGNSDGARQAIRRALLLCSARARGPAAFVGARLMLQASKLQPTEKERCLHDVCRLLEECLRLEPGHIEALWQLAAVRIVLGDREAQVKLATALNRPDVPDPRFHFVAAACFLVAEAWQLAVAAAERAAAEPLLSGEAHYLKGLAALHLQDRSTALAALEKAAGSATGHVTDHARALLGQLHFEAGRFEDAIQRWQGVDQQKRAAWRLDEPLRATVFLTALDALSQQQYQAAAERFREAGKLGLRERQLGSLISQSLVRAGQQLLFSDGK